MKKFICVLMVCFSVMILVSCAQVEYFIGFYADGKVTMGVASSIDENVVNEARKKDPNIASMDTINKTINSLMQEHKTATENKLKDKVDVKIVVANQKENGIQSTTMTIEYKSTEDYIKAAAILAGQDVAEGETEKEKPIKLESINWFIKRQTLLKSDNAFYSNLSLIDNMEKAFGMLGLSYFDENKDVLYVQTIAYPNRRVKSNADKIMKYGDSSLHIFSMTKKEMADKNVTLYVNYPKSETWFALALIVTAVFIGGFITYNIVKNRVKKIK